MVDGPPSSMQLRAADVQLILPIGSVVGGNYEIKRLLGSGGMGQVFEAQDRELNRRVALKLCWPHIDATLLRKEAQALAAVQHPGVIQVFAYGVHESLPYFVMERILGTDLEGHVEKRKAGGHPLELAEKLELLVGLAEVLAAVHVAGIAHRDIKPANVMLSANGRIVLTDFGVFRPESAGSPTEIAGTASYIAPEGIRADVALGSAFLLDVYAFGVLAWELIAGFVPFDGETVHDILHAHLNYTPPAVHEVSPEAPEELGRLIADLTAKSADERPHSMQIVAQRLSGMRARVLETATLPFSVLIAEDEPAVAKIVSARLRATLPGCDVQLVDDGEAALRALRKGLPDLLILDVNLPGTNGIEVLMELLGMPGAERCVVVPISGESRAGEIRLFEQMGVKNFVQKGAGFAERLLNTVLPLHRAQLAASGRLRR